MPRKPGPYYKDNPETKRAYAKRYHFAHQERRAELRKARYERSKQKESMQGTARRAGGFYAELTVELWAWLREVYGHACAYCGEPDVVLTVDHIKPTAAGGSHCIDNVVPACLACNSSKCSREVDAWLSWKGWCIDTFHESRRNVMAAYYQYQCEQSS